MTSAQRPTESAARSPFPKAISSFPSLISSRKDSSTSSSPRTGTPRSTSPFATTHGKQTYEVIEAPYGPQTLWPEHCLQHSEGAALHPALDIPHAELILRKGFHHHIDSYSAFLENDHATPTGLAGYLRERGLARLFLVGLAYDFCVRYSAIDGHALGFETIVIEDATRPVNLPGSVAQTNAALAASNIPRIQSSDILAR